MDARERSYDIAGPRDGLKTRRAGRDYRFDQRVPGATVGTLSLPLAASTAAFGAAVCGLGLRHESSVELVGRYDGGTKLADDNASGLIGDVHRAIQVGSSAEQRAQCGDHGVARA